MPVTPAVALTSTPDASAGNPIAVFTVNAGVGPADAQAVVPVDATTGLPPVGGLPVSAASLPLPTNAAQETGGHLAAIDTNAGAQADAAVTTDVNASLAAKLRGLVKILGDVWVSGSHWLQVSIMNATLAVTQSGTWTVVQGAAAALSSAWGVKITDASNGPVAVKPASTSAVAADPALVVQLSPNNPSTAQVTVLQGGPFLVKDTVGASILATAKGTQATNLLGVQEAKDSGRVNIMWTAEVAGAATTEGLLTVTESRDGAATTTFTSKVVTSGKRLRITSVQIAVESLGSGTAPQRCYLRMRFNTAGAVVVGSPQQTSWECANNPAVVKTATSFSFDFPDGIEFLGDGTKQIGFTIQFPDFVTTTATVQAKITITAFEY